MELIFKRPDKKLPFLGLLFESEFKASRSNQKVVLAGQPCDMKIDFLGSHVTLRITNNETGFFHMYQEPISCDVKKFQVWRESTNQPYNFGHIIREYDVDKVVRTQDERKLFVVRIVSLWVEYEY